MCTSFVLFYLAHHRAVTTVGRWECLLKNAPNVRKNSQAGDPLVDCNVMGDADCTFVNPVQKSARNLSNF
jgi:hypothetical protein